MGFEKRKKGKFETAEKFAERIKKSRKRQKQHWEKHRRR